MKSCVFLRFMMRFVDLFCRFGGTAAVSSCAKKCPLTLKKEHKNRNNKKGTRRKKENGVVMMVCVLLLIFYMTKKG